MKLADVGSLLFCKAGSRRATCTIIAQLVFLTQHVKSHLASSLRKRMWLLEALSLDFPDAALAHGAQAFSK